MFSKVKYLLLLISVYSYTFCSKNSKMSWETPAEQIQSSISGPMAKVLAVVVIVVAAFSWVVTPDSGIMGKAIRIVIALAIVGGATVLLGLFNITGGVLIG